jgi:thiamine-phosphate pyrophosphorylase
VLLYYITDHRQFPGGEAAQRTQLLSRISDAARYEVDYVQLREKDLSARELEELAVQALGAIAKAGTRTALLVNSRSDVAIAAGARGVHLRSQDISPAAVRELWAKSPSAGTSPVLGVSCHKPEEISAAQAHGANFAVFAPIFEKRDAPSVSPAGLERLRQACGHGIPVFALGGINLQNAQSCVEAGAAGIAGIRLFQENDIGDVVARLRP